MTLEEAFLKLVSRDWDNLKEILRREKDTEEEAELRAKEFKNKYRPYRSKFRNKRGSIGPHIMLEMLNQCNYKINVEKTK